MDFETKYNIAKGALIAFCLIALVISYNGATGVQEKIEMRRVALSRADDEYLLMKGKVVGWDKLPEKAHEVAHLRSQMESLKREYNLYSGYNDPVINKYENGRMFWMWIFVFSFMGLGQLFKPVRWLFYAVLAGVGINMLRNNN